MHQRRQKGLSKQKRNGLKLIDYNGYYKDLVLFTPNKYQPVHRWFSLVEGFSSELVRRIIGEQEVHPQICLDPFGGIGTTALTCQDIGTKCFSFENNPFFFEVARTKLRTDYNPKEFAKHIKGFETSLKRFKKEQKPPCFETKTLFKTKGKDRWIFNKPVMNSIMDILSIIESLERDSSLYTGLFKVALASILVSVSNVFRNGKCLSYKQGWQDVKIKRNEVHRKFIDACKNIMLVDIRTKYLSKPLVYNYVNYIYGDARKLLEEVPNKSVDLVITSPPYLNSRDYTDTYRLELWILGYISTYEEERKLRNSAIRSHVQVKLEDCDYLAVPTLRKFMKHLEHVNGNLWNHNIPNMVKGYFKDIEGILYLLKAKLKSKGKIYLNVANSAYGGKICQVDIIISEVAEDLGFKTSEIRVVRHVKSSRQQSHIKKLRESIIVLEN